MRIVNITAGFILVSLIVFILHAGQALLMPFVAALVIWYIILEFTLFFKKIPFGQFYLPYSGAFVLSLIFASILMYGFFHLLSSSISNIIIDAPRYQEKLKLALTTINAWLGSGIQLNSLFQDINLANLFSTLALMLSSLVSNFTLVLIYLLFLFLEAKTFPLKLQGLFDQSDSYHRASQLISQITQDINHFLKAKVFLNLIAGLSSYLVLEGFGIQYAGFWGVFIFLMHFIPFIGSIIAVILVMLAVSIQVTSLLSYGVLGCILITIQFLVGNVIEPKIMGKTLNLSPIVILLALAFWGYIWGILGMFLCVPIMVILNIIFAHFPSSRYLAVLMSADPSLIDKKAAENYPGRG
jgi:predicted PurR-regulated permease PerM